jgi:hypothetical protein
VGLEIQIILAAVAAALLNLVVQVEGMDQDQLVLVDQVVQGHHQQLRE